jgi:hypothetical protein
MPPVRIGFRSDGRGGVIASVVVVIGAHSGDRTVEQNKLATKPESVGPKAENIRSIHIGITVAAGDFRI